MSRVIWSPKSLENIEDASDFISLDSPNRAKKWVESIFETAKNIKEFPFSGRIVEELCDSNIREVIKGNYRIVYEIHGKNIEILAVRNFAQSKIFDEI